MKTNADEVSTQAVSPLSIICSPVRVEWSPWGLQRSYYNGVGLIFNHLDGLGLIS